VSQRNFNSIYLLDLLETENTNLKNTIIGHKYLAKPGIRFLFEEYPQTKKSKEKINCIGSQGPGVFARTTEQLVLIFLYGACAKFYNYLKQF